MRRSPIDAAQTLQNAPLPDSPHRKARRSAARDSATQNRISATKRNLCRTFQLSTICRQLKRSDCIFCSAPPLVCGSIHCLVLPIQSVRCKSIKHFAIKIIKQKQCALKAGITTTTVARNALLARLGNALVE